MLDRELAAGVTPVTTFFRCLFGRKWKRLQDEQNRLQDEQNRQQGEWKRLQDEQNRLQGEWKRLQDEQERLFGPNTVLLFKK